MKAIRRTVKAGDSLRLASRRALLSGRINPLSDLAQEMMNANKEWDSSKRSMFRTFSEKSITRIAENKIQQIFLSDEQPPGIRGEITEDVILDWFKEILREARKELIPKPPTS